MVGVLASCLFAGCGGDAEENLQALPGKIVDLIRAGDWDDAWDYLADDFAAHGLTGPQIRALVPRHLEDAKLSPFVAHVFTRSEEEGDDERTLTVIGILCRGDPMDASPRQMRPFQAELRVRVDGDDWTIVSATVHR